MSNLAAAFAGGADLFKPGTVEVSGVPEGLDAMVLADLARQAKQTRAPGESGPIFVHVARDDKRLAGLAETLRFFAPDLEIARLPAWDCLPYDRVSPAASVAARRIAALCNLAGDQPTVDIVLTTVNSVLQRVPPRGEMRAHSRFLTPGGLHNMAEIAEWLVQHGYERTATVRDPSSFAVRGGILDLFPPAHEQPVRLDFFGDTLESIRSFDAESQRTLAQLHEISLLPVSEAILTPEAIERFRAGYRATFGAVTGDDAVYTGVSEGHRASGMEHWLPLFYEKLETLFEYVPGAAWSFDNLAQDSRDRRLEQIADYFDARQNSEQLASTSASPYRALRPETLYLSGQNWNEALRNCAVFQLSPFERADSNTDTVSLAAAGRIGRSFAAERTAPDGELFDAVVRHIDDLNARKKQVVIACWSEGSRQRMMQMLEDHGLKNAAQVTSWTDVQALGGSAKALALLGLEAGFETPTAAFICEQDILGERMVNRSRRSRRDSDFLTEVTSLSRGDFVVHVDHGIGQFMNLRTIEAVGAPHDCLEIKYAGGDLLFIPVENIELLSRYGSDDAGAQLDRLGGAGWQARKAKLKDRVREIAGELIKIAAARAMRVAPAIPVPEGLYEEFCARFPYDETEDQLNALDSVIDDLAAGRPMDRLICGDVGFGKTEVAVRAAFLTAMSGRQVALVVPTTLLARQHTQTFVDRFRGLPVHIGQLSRLVSAKETAEIKEGLKSGKIDIVIGTHALLAKNVGFRDLGLLVIDEEQHFGVTHKERLKQLRAEVHVLTLTATPIPRTLQQALTGIRDLSLIATPPVDRLAVRTFVTPYDPVTIREAILREHYRGGQTYYVCPRISDLGEIAAFLQEQIPEIRFRTAHGQMPTGELEDIMTAFYDGKFDCLLSTTIVQSGLDVPNANTMIIHRADKFGLAQLYQIRGRVGRSKIRAYALLTIPTNFRMTEGAEKRLKVLQSLDYLGAGFMLANYDMDLRGAGNLLGDEQSGHIKEVGFELYQNMLEEAVAELDASPDRGDDSQWSPQIAAGAAILIPERYVTDLDLRLNLYRRLSTLQSQEEIEAFAAELVDRFGSLPEEAEQLLQIVGIKMLCRRAGIEKLDAGPRGALITFRENKFSNPHGLIELITSEGPLARLRPDHKLVIKRDWEDVETRLKGIAILLRRIVSAANTKKGG